MAGVFPDCHGARDPLVESLGRSLSLLPFCWAEFPEAQLLCEPYPTSHPSPGCPGKNSAVLLLLAGVAGMQSSPQAFHRGRGLEAQALPVKMNRTIIFNQNSLL